MNHPQFGRKEPPTPNWNSRPANAHASKPSPQRAKGQSNNEAVPSREKLGTLLTSYGVPLSGKILDKLWIYHQMLRKNNGDQDLTRLIGFETIVQRHYADCLILHGKMKEKWPSPMVDIGTGAGFPGLMIKLVSPQTEIILSEPRPRRVEFLNMAIRELGMTGISVFGHKFTSRSFTTPVQGAITRAFESIALTLPRLGSSLAVGGKAIFMKGPGVDEELNEALPPDYKLIRDDRYRIAGTTLDRALIILERTGKFPS